jgi:hypothetical protein
MAYSFELTISTAAIYRRQHFDGSAFQACKLGAKYYLK